MSFRSTLTPPSPSIATPVAICYDALGHSSQYPASVIYTNGVKTIADQDGGKFWGHTPSGYRFLYPKPVSIRQWRATMLSTDVTSQFSDTRYPGSY